MSGRTCFIVTMVGDDLIPLGVTVIPDGNREVVLVLTSDMIRTIKGTDDGPALN